MKIKKINKNIVKNWTIFLILAVLLVLNSCSNFLSFEENKTDKTAMQNNKCIITVSSDFSESEGLFSRAAFPNFVLATETLYFAEISYTSASSKKWLGEDSVCETAVVIKNNYSDEIRFVFCVPQETSLYTLTLYACPKQTESQISAVKNSAFAQGSTTFTLSAGQKSLSSSLNIELKPQETSGTGSVKLPLSFDSALGIVAAKVNVTKDGVSDSSGNNYEFEISVSESAAMLSAENVPAGTYLAIMKFYKSTTDFSSVNEVAVNFAVQQISVYSGMTSDCWFVDGKKIGTTGADGVFTPSALELTKYDFTELYVLGSDAASGEIDGKLVFYNEAHFGSSIPTITNVNGGDGSMTNPFATVQKAVDKIAAAGDTSKKYTIYVDGTVTADSGDDFTTDSAINDKSFIYISSSNKLDLTIKGFSQDSKAVLDANQKDGSLNGNVLTVNASNANITLENLTITGGSRSATGGGIYAKGSLTLKKCTVTKNKSNNAGGGISFSGKELVLENTSVTYNESSSNGGGINADGKVTISDSEILNNSATANGGGIYFGDGEKTISGTTVNKNSAEFGGGIYMQAGTLNLESGAIIGEKLDPDANDISKVATSSDYGNKATDTSYSRAGAGLYIQSGTVNMSEGVYICKNYTSSYGGGVYVSPNGIFNMSGGVIGWNFSRMGGGIIADGADASTSSYSVLNISGTAKICYNRADFTSAEGCTGRGAGIFACGDLTISENVEIFKNQAAKSGSGIHFEKKLVMKGGSIHDNKAETDGAGIFAYKGEAELSVCKISGNEAGGNGGAIYANNENSRITVKIGEENNSNGDVLIEKNSANRGGAFYGANNADFVMNAGKVSENYSLGNGSGDGGGAMFLWGAQSNYSTFTMNGGEISGNMAKSGGCGGAVHIDHGTGGKAAFIMKGGLLSGNKATDENGIGSKLGGAIYLKAGGKIELSGSAVIDVEKDFNDIYLGISTESVQQKITITGTLAPGNNDAAGNQKYTARITPEEYAVEKEFFQSDSYTITSDDYEKFCVTGNDDSDEWFITGSGYLSKPTAISSLSSAPDFSIYPKLTVSTGDEMKSLADWVNAGNNMEGVTFTLQDNVTIDSMIGFMTSDGAKKFEGTFDGNGNTITSNVELDSIFCFVEGGEIKNVISEGKFLKAGIASYLKNGIIENCKNNAMISATDSVGGIVIQLQEGGKIKNCINNGKVAGTNCVGGIAGEPFEDGSILNCINLGEIENTGSGEAGGIAGYNYKGVIDNCVNVGQITGSSDDRVGAIAGYNWSDEYIKKAYYLKGSANRAVGNRVAVNTTFSFDSPSDELITKLNAWVTANSTETEKYLEWKIVDGNPSLVYE